MIPTVFTIGIILTVVMVVLGIILSRSNLKGYTLYYPFAGVFIIGLLLLLFATILEKQTPFGLEAGLGGWGLACIFSAAISWIITTVLDAYAQPES